ncbi:MAG: DUF3822 family protein, partial [Flavitalea sp.]
PELFQESILVLEIGEKLFSAMILNSDADQLLALKYFNMDAQSLRPMAEFIAEILAVEPVLSRKFSKTVVVYSFPESNLLPKQFNDNNVDRALTQLIHGNVQKGLILQEEVPGKEMVNVYRVSKELQNFVEQQFKPSVYRHAYSIIASSELTDENLLQVRFYNDRFTAVLWKSGQLQMVQSFTYQSPEDVSYNLLSIAENFEVSPEVLKIEVSGLLDEHSSLYLELNKFFLHIEAAKASDKIDTGELLADYPEHYFSPMLNFAVCV